MMTMTPSTPESPATTPEPPKTVAAVSLEAEAPAAPQRPALNEPDKKHSAAAELAALRHDRAAIVRLFETGQYPYKTKIG